MPSRRVINGYDFATCSHCGQPGKLGAEMRIHAVEIPGEKERPVRVLHVERCTGEWFGKFYQWVTARGKSKN